MVGQLGVVESLPSFVDQLPVHLHPWTVFAHSLVDRGNLCQVFFPRATVGGKALFSLEEGEDLTQLFNFFFPFFSCSRCGFLSQSRLQVSRDWFEGVQIPQLFIEARFRVEVDERVEGGVEIKVDVQNEVVNL